MKIENINTGENSQVNIADNIICPTNLIEVTPQNIDKLLNQLNQDQKELLSRLTNDAKKSKTQDSISKLSEFINSHILPIGYSISGSALFEMIKNII